MKRKLLVSLILLVLLFFLGCNKKTYEFKNPVDKIKSIEIVSAENSFEFTIIKTLSEIEKNDFIKKFQMIKFDSYFVGDPMSLNGNAVRITYQNGDYEMICFYWAEYVKNDEVFFVRKYCDKKEFNELLNYFLSNEGGN